MKHLLFIAALALSVFLTGCRSAERTPNEIGGVTSLDEGESIITVNGVEIVRIDMDTENAGNNTETSTDFLTEFKAHTAELAKRLPLEYDWEIPDNMTYGYIVDDGKYFLYNKMRYENRMPSSHYEAERSTLNALKARIVFKDGTPATEDDLKAETPVFIKWYGEWETYPSQILCSEIVILK